MEVSNPEKYVNVFRRFYWCTFIFCKEKAFFKLFLFKNGCPNGSETLIIRKYIQFVIEWYMIFLYVMSLYMIKIESSKFFLQKSPNCPINRSSLFEPCPNALFYNLILVHFSVNFFFFIYRKSKEHFFDQD